VIIGGGGIQEIWFAFCSLKNRGEGSSLRKERKVG